MASQKALSFHGQQAIKDKYVSRAEAHYAADEIIKGVYWESGKGCAVGCLTHKRIGSHAALVEQIGIPLTMAYLIDRLFENLPNVTAQSFPVRFIKAIPVAVDLSLVMDKFYLALLSDPEHGVIRHANDKVRPSIQAVINCFARRIAGQNPELKEWREVRAAAYAAAAASAAAYAAYAAYAADAYASAAASAAAYAADAAADAYAASAAAYAADAAADAADAAAADAAADAADAAAAYAADAAASAAAYAADAAAARNNAFIWQSELLIGLIEAVVLEPVAA